MLFHTYLQRIKYATKMTTFSYKNLDSIRSQDIETFLKSFDTVLTDCDGVLWNGPRPIKGSPEAIQGLRQLGKRVIFVTNNPRSRTDVLDKCINLGFGGCISDVITSSYLCARYLTLQNFKQKVYAFGSKGLRDELENVGIRHVGCGPDYSNDIRLSIEGQGLTVKGLKDPDPEVGAVIVSFSRDPPFNYERIVEITHYLNQKIAIDPGAGKEGNVDKETIDMPFIVSDPDPVIPAMNHETKQKVKVPGTGVFAAAVEAAVKRSPIIVGKPSSFVFNVISQDNPDITPERTLMIGDNLDTDIQLGKNCNLITLLVGSGIHSIHDLEHNQVSTDIVKSSLVPNFFASSLGVLVSHINNIL